VNSRDTQKQSAPDGGPGLVSRRRVLVLVVGEPDAERWNRASGHVSFMSGKHTELQSRSINRSAGGGRPNAVSWVLTD
jgi:hypothetical protein